MSSDTTIVISILAIVGIIAAVVIVNYLIVGTRRRTWEEVATRLGLSYTPGNLLGGGISVSGNYHNQQLTLDTFTRSSGKSATTYTRIVLSLTQPTQLELSLSTESVISKIGKVLGAGDIQTGDEALDQRYVIKGQPENMIATLLQSYDLRQKLVEAPSLSIKVRGQEIYYEKRGFNGDENSLIALFDLLTSLANGIERLQ